MLKNWNHQRTRNNTNKTTTKHTKHTKQERTEILDSDHLLDFAINASISSGSFGTFAVRL